MFRCLMAATVMVLALGPMSAATGEEFIHLSDTQIARLGIAHGEVRAGERQQLTVVPGRITAPLDALLTMAAPFAGTVLSVQTLEGAKVSAGADLLVIASNEYLAVQSRHAQAAADYRALKASADRLKTLSDEGIVAEARLQAKEAEAARATVELEATARLLEQVKPVQGQQGAYSLVAPKDATIAQLSVMPGDMIDALDGAVVLEDAGALWLEAELPARFMGQVTVGDTARLEAYGIAGKIIAVGRVVDRQSRSVTVRAALESHAALKPGQSVQAMILSAAQAGSLSVPRDAIVRLAGDEVVFLLTANGYQPIPVTVLSRGVNEAIVTGNLTKGAKVAVSGLTELKALALEGQ
ncbi:efflux RND transporter periplasmic adaptor subunit [Kordiimonas sp.]|uniref:efflux RND transporter periplasmic adaptor subunit n=1 Tax=Kordiimonas sp. TaxID=1970157 RepID=UPI003A91C577